jgi:SAM-dependent methyltransferase
MGQCRSWGAAYATLTRMPAYALLLAPSANRVYADSAVDLTVAELAAFGRVLTAPLTDIAPTRIAGVPYVTFTADLAGADLAYLANASTAYALFERVEDQLRPIELTPLDRFDDDLVTIPKYAGKTNEQFTKLLLNLTLLARAEPADLLRRRLRILDPLCGRGTTLNQALTYGYDVAGIDLDGKDFEAYGAFLQTYLKRKRLKHKYEMVPVRRERRLVARRMRVSVAPNRTDKAPSADEPLSLDVVCADTVAARDFFRPASVDAIVTDAPYGVQHGSRTVAVGLRRSPLDLLAAAVPGWATILRPGATIGIAINTLVSRRPEVAAILAEAGLIVVDEGPYGQLQHRVDQAITRDVVVARKP